MQATYKIGEAATRLNLKTYVLRFWETEFPQIIPLRTEKGQRLYTEEHIALLKRIRHLLHERGLTIEGARKALAEEAARGMLYTDDALADAGEEPSSDEAEDHAEETGTLPASLPRTLGTPPAPELEHGPHEVPLPLLTTAPARLAPLEEPRACPPPEAPVFSREQLFALVRELEAVKTLLSTPIHKENF